jgi:hypothetical protein
MICFYIRYKPCLAAFVAPTPTTRTPCLVLDPQRHRGVEREAYQIHQIPTERPEEWELVESFLASKNEYNSSTVLWLIILQPVRLNFQPLIFSQPTVFFSRINQPTVLSATYFQPKRTSC